MKKLPCQIFIPLLAGASVVSSAAAVEFQASPGQLLCSNYENLAAFVRDSITARPLPAGYGCYPVRTAAKVVVLQEFPRLPTGYWIVRVSVENAVEGFMVSDVAARESERRGAEQAAEAARKKAIADHEVKVGVQRSTDAANGFQRTSFQDFELDGKQLAYDGKKVSIEGHYTKIGELSLLFPTPVAALMGAQNLALEGSIGLLIDDAAREVRKYFASSRSRVGDFSLINFD
jgi:hypothetical protein